jgi:hypothetical protein
MNHALTEVAGVVIFKNRKIGALWPNCNVFTAIGLGDRPWNILDRSAIFPLGGQALLAR